MTSHLTLLSPQDRAFRVQHNLFCSGRRQHRERRLSIFGKRKGKELRLPLRVYGVDRQGRDHVGCAMALPHHTTNSHV